MTDGSDWKKTHKEARTLKVTFTGSMAQVEHLVRKLCGAGIDDLVVRFGDYADAPTIKAWDDIPELLFNCDDHERAKQFWDSLPETVKKS